MRDQQFINRDSFLLKRLNGSFYINRTRDEGTAALQCTYDDRFRISLGFNGG